MPQTLTTAAIEESTYVITITPKTATGGSVTPNSIVWRLYDEDGLIVNSRSGVTCTAPSTSNTIVLYANDLAMPDPHKPRRKLTIDATYDGSEGTSMPLHDEVTFTIIELTGIS